MITTRASGRVVKAPCLGIPKGNLDFRGSPERRFESCGAHLSFYHFFGQTFAYFAGRQPVCNKIFQLMLEEKLSAHCPARQFTRSLQVVSPLIIPTIHRA